MAILLALAAVPAGLGVVPTPVSQGPLFPPDEAIKLHLKAKTQSSEPFLSLSPDADSAAQYQAADASAAIQRTGGNIASGDRTSVEFKLPTAPDKPKWFNLSRPILGTLYLQTSLSQKAGRDGYAHVRLDLLSGDTLVGGQEFLLNSIDALPGWVPFGLRFTSEVNRLEAGKPLRLLVSLVSGDADFFIGTAGAQQSFLELRVIPFDPLSSVVYLEDNYQRSIKFGSTGGAPGDSSSPDASWTLWGFAALPALALARRPGTRRHAVFLLAVALSLASAGCFRGSASPRDTVDDGTSTDGPQKPVVSETLEPRPDLQAAGHGAVDGVVHTDIGLPLPRVEVNILGTVLVAKANDKGFFSFPNVSAGAYRARFTLDSYVPAEENVTVKTGNVTHLDVKMVKPDDPTRNFKPHHHNEQWEGKDEKLLWHAEFTPGDLSSGLVPGGVASPVFTCGGTQSASYPVPLTADQPVPPGANRIDVKVAWTAGARDVKEIGLTVANALHPDWTDTSRPDLRYHFLPRRSGSTFGIAFYPNEADPGHQPYTGWKFWVRCPLSSLFSPDAPPMTLGEDFVVDITAFRAVDPFEPEHPDFWTNQTELTLIDAKPPNQNTVCCYDPPAEGKGWTTQAMVPPGTKQIKGTLKWTSPAGTAIPWSIAFLTAESTPGTQPVRHPAQETRAADHVDFTFDVTAKEADKFYQHASIWKYMLDDKTDASYATNAAAAEPIERPTLTIIAVKDPAYVD